MQEVVSYRRRHHISKLKLFFYFDYFTEQLKEINRASSNKPSTKQYKIHMAVLISKFYFGG
jgi:hypothetical protein